jgi:TATA-binding protein-associated factor Taf7
VKQGWQAPLAATENEEPKYSGAEIGLEFEEVLKRASLNNEDAEDSDEEEAVADEEMEGTGIGGIQTKLMTKVLPILERHLTESKSTKDEDGQPVIRSFVVMSIIKLLRRMPLTTFQHGIGKLVSTIVSKGLR